MFKERGIHVWLVCCGSIRRLIISFAVNESYCRSHLKNEVYRVTPRLIISFVSNGSYCRSSCFRYCRSRFRSKRVILSLTLKERGMHIWLVYCGSIPSIISFALNGSYCRSRLKNEVYIFGLFVVAHAFAVVAHAFAPNGSHCRSHLKNEVYMHVWFALLWQMQFSTYNFPIVYGPKTVLTIRTNRTDRQTAVTPSLE